MAQGHRGWLALNLILGAAAMGLLGWSASAGAQRITEYVIPSIPNGAGTPRAITAGPDGALWFSDVQAIGRITTSGMVTLYPNRSSDASAGITSGPDGALWFIDRGGNKIGRVTTSGTITEFPIPTFSSGPLGIAAGPDGALWFTENDVNANKIGRITTSGVIAEFPIPTAVSLPFGITAGPDGAMWFTEGSSLKIGRITVSGAITEFPTRPGGTLSGITAGPDGALWYGAEGYIGRITTSGTFTAYPTPTIGGHSLVNSIVTGPDGALWFTDAQTNSIGRITTAGSITEFPIPTPNNNPVGIATGSDGAVWFVESLLGKIGRITTGNTVALVAAVLPSSRSVMVGNTATAFATIINAGATAASGCAIVPVTPVPASFVYQTTNPQTNALTGSPNTPVSLAANNGSQTFVIALTPNAPVVPTTVVFGFDCAGVAAAPSYTGVNTLLYSASATPVPDIIALAATTQNDGILHITGNSGSNAFAVATINVGAGAAVTATATSGAATLPLAISICQTNPATAQCLGTPAPSASTTIGPNATPTFSIFATASGQVPFLPQTNRIFVQFSDANGMVRGSTSVALQTQ